MRKSTWQLVNTVVPFLVLWYLDYRSLSIGYWLSLVLAVPTAGFLIRTFIIFHDCGHHSFFKSRRANDIAGILLGMLTLFPYHRWKYDHSVHHAGNGNLNRRGIGDIFTLTVEEYLSLPFRRRLMYRLYRNPLVMFGLGPIYLILIQYRFARKGAGRRERLNTHLTNVVLVGVVACLAFVAGWRQFLEIEGPILYLAGMVGIWLFYVQHQFENSYLEKEENWDYVTAAIRGSSFYKLPKVLQWITGNIGFHHIHHLGPRVPNYHLQSLFDRIPYLQRVPTFNLFTAFKSLRYRLWDEETKKFVSFRDIVPHYKPKPEM